MGNSMLDQMKKAGMINQKQAQKAKKANTNRDKQLRKGQIDEQSEKAKQAELEKQRQAQIKRDRELNQKKNEQAQARALEAQVKQIIEMNALTFGEDTVSFHFQDGQLVKEIHVDEKARKYLSKGNLAVAKIDNRYHVIPGLAADKIAERQEHIIVVRHQSNDEDLQAEDDDPYADFQVPDDLMW